MLNLKSRNKIHGLSEGDNQNSICIDNKKGIEVRRRSRWRGRSRLAELASCTRAGATARPRLRSIQLPEYFAEKRRHDHNPRERHYARKLHTDATRPPLLCNRSYFPARHRTTTRTKRIQRD